MPRHVGITIFGASDVPKTLTGSCGPAPGIACRLVWDVSHNGQAAELTNTYLAGPVHLLLKVSFVVLLALVIRILVHRVINRLTERAAYGFILPQFRGEAAASRLAPGMLARQPVRYLRQRRSRRAAGRGRRRPVARDGSDHGRRAAQEAAVR